MLIFMGGMSINHCSLEYLSRALVKPVQPDEIHTYVNFVVMTDTTQALCLVQLLLTQHVPDTAEYCKWPCYSYGLVIEGL